MLNMVVLKETVSFRWLKNTDTIVIFSHSFCFNMDICLIFILYKTLSRPYVRPPPPHYRDPAMGLDLKLGTTEVEDNQNVSVCGLSL
jgi:hypothetical protein